MPFIALALFLAAAVGGGASIAAQNALPGDALWGFKVGINENIEAALAADGQAQADFDIKAIEARMQEAAELSANARLTADVRADIEANFESHVKSVQAQVAKLEAEGKYSAAADVAARFQATLAAHASALSEAGVSTELDTFIHKIRTTLDTASTLSAQASAKAAAQIAI